MQAIIVAVVVVALGAAAYRTWRQHRAAGGAADGPAAIVGWAADLLSADRAEWGQAMLGELAQYQGAARWRYAMGCAVAAFGLPGRARSGRWAVLAVLGGAIASAGLVGYGVIRYPGLVLGAGTWLTLAMFAAVLVSFVLVTGVATRRSPVGLTGLVTGGALAAVSMAVGAVAFSGWGKGLVFLVLLLPVVAAGSGVVGGRAGRDRREGRRRVWVSAIVAALVVFLVLAGDTLITGGRPYDAGQLRDFASSGYPDLATYAVSDNLGTAMVVLLFTSVVTAAFGLVGTALATPRG